MLERNAASTQIAPKTKNMRRISDPAQMSDRIKELGSVELAVK